MIAGNAVISAALLIWVLGMMMRVRRGAGAALQENMVGRLGQAQEDFTGEGYVHLEGELWRAVSSTPLLRGQTVRVKSMEGLLLHVEPIA
jgi:membrane-bound serine protease (ClpP class)